MFGKRKKKDEAKPSSTEQETRVVAPVENTTLYERPPSPLTAQQHPSPGSASQPVVSEPVPAEPKAPRREARREQLPPDGQNASPAHDLEAPPLAPIRPGLYGAAAGAAGAGVQPPASGILPQ